MQKRLTSDEPPGAQEVVRPDRLQQVSMHPATWNAFLGRAWRGARLGVGRLGRRRIRLKAALAAIVVLGARAGRQRRQASRHLQALD